MRPTNLLSIVTLLFTFVASIANGNEPTWQTQVFAKERVDTTYNASVEDLYGNLILVGGPTVTKVSPSGVVLWQTRLDSITNGIQPAIDASSDVYIVGWTQLYKLNGTTGVETWSVDLREHGVSQATAMFDAGTKTVVVTGESQLGKNGIAVRFSKETGLRVAKKTYLDQPLGRAVKVTGGLVAPTTADRLIKLAMGDLSVQWVRTLTVPSGYSRSTPAGLLSDGASTLYARVSLREEGSGTWKDALALVDPSSGDTLWLEPVPSQNLSFDLAMAPSGDAIFATVSPTSFTSTLTRYSKAEGDVVWTRGFPDSIHELAVDSHGSIYAPIGRQDDRFTRLGLARFSSTDGSTVFSVYPPETAKGRASVNSCHFIDGKVAVVGQTRTSVDTATLWWFDSSSGSLLRKDSYGERAEVSLNPLEPIIVGNDTIVTASGRTSFQITRLNASGTQIWNRTVFLPEQPLPIGSYWAVKRANYAVAADGRPSMFVFASIQDQGFGSKPDPYLMRFDATDGRRLWTIRLAALTALPHVFEVLFAPDGDAFVFVSADTGRARMLRIGGVSHKALARIPLPFSWSPTQPYELAFGPSGGLFYADSWSLRRIDPSAGSELWKTWFGQGYVLAPETSLIFDGGGGCIVQQQGETDKRIQRIGLGTGTVLYTRPLAPEAGNLTVIPGGDALTIEPKDDGTTLFRAFKTSDGSDAWSTSINLDLRQKWVSSVVVTPLNRLAMSIRSQDSGWPYDLYHWEVGAFDLTNKEWAWSSSATTISTTGSHGPFVSALANGNVVAVGTKVGTGQVNGISIAAYIDP